MKHYFFVWWLFFSSNLMMAQHKTIDFLAEHQKYILLAEQVKGKLETSEAKFTFQLHLYGKDNIAIEWKKIAPQSSISLHLRMMQQPSIFELRGDKSIKEDQQKSIENFIRHFIKTPSSTSPLLFESYQRQGILNYLEKADSIAFNAYACNVGDHYQAGLYSEIIISESCLQLHQINWWNAESLDRKNYCMRKLAFLVPFQENKNQALDILKKEFFETEIYPFQNMLIGFQDHSAPNYRTCGQAIMVAIKNINH
jgi:hypothetical protein